MFSIENIIRKKIRSLVPYSSARSEFSGEAKIYLDANENSLGSIFNDYNRYPDPMQVELKQAISSLKKIAPGNIFLGNGSDECIDLLYRCFCEPGVDNVIICPPTYGMYQVSAEINDVALKSVPLTPAFRLDEQALIAAIDNRTKLVWICSPNNPTGNTLEKDVILRLLRSFNGIVVVDEAYIDFSTGGSYVTLLEEYPNLVVLQTFSKAWGLAGLRLGMAFASAEIISVMNKVKPPYNINQVTQELVLEAIGRAAEAEKAIGVLIEEREKLRTALDSLEAVVEVYPSDANFLLVKTTDNRGLYDFLLRRGIVVRDRGNVLHCAGCLRITIGTPEENKMIVAAIKNYLTQTV